jgi:hypothetical protein
MLYFLYKTSPNVSQVAFHIVQGKKFIHIYRYFNLVEGYVVDLIYMRAGEEMPPVFFFHGCTVQVMSSDF